MRNTRVTRMKPLPRLLPETLEARLLYSGSWEAAAPAPVALGEVAGGVIGEKLYLVGEGNPATLVYDFAADSWSAAAARPDPGNHHAAEVIGGKLYLFGGLTGGSGGEVQIYDPAADAWSKGADMPFAAGSGSSAVIGGLAYVAGGITAAGTTDRVARYDPAADAWADLAPMPRGRNHAASATDGSKLWVFGGRGPGSGDFNVTTNGFDDVQVYDPAANSWAWSGDLAAQLPALPQRRGGMGKAVFLGGEFYVIGGETLTDPGATPDGVFDRVDVFDPSARAWRLDAPMPTARHGIFPLAFDGRIYVAAGGVHFGGSQSKVTEVFTPEAEPPPPPPPPQPATVVGRWVFYNNSVFDGNDAAANAADDGAVATDKAALLPGQAATFANYTGYSKGINGLMVDVAGLPAGAEAPVSAADFGFSIGNDDRPAAWAAAPAPASVTVRRGAGAGGSDRVTLVWPDGQVQKQWLRVSVRPTAATGLPVEDVFYFGNAVGETGNRAGDARVNGADVRRVRRNRTRKQRPGQPPPPAAPVTTPFDLDRDGVVGLLDRQVVKRNRTGRFDALALLSTGVI
jgi:N-acetylneuraminic acid mutarotase